ncbi:MAG: Maf family protein [Anaerolineae bacterium]
MEPNLILASASPRRRQLLSELGVSYEVRPADVDETPMPGESAPDHAARLALAKARAVAGTVGSGLVLGADTVVVLDGQILGKPRSPDEALRHVTRLRGRNHQVITAVALVDADGREWCDSESTVVWIRDFGDDEARRYVESGDPFDKAGAYAIQNEEFRPVSRLEGSRSNVVGLPLRLTARLLAEAGVDVAPAGATAAEGAEGA